MFCPNCGRENPDGSAFCNHCGGSLRPGENAPAPAKKRAAGTNVLFWIGFILACVGIIGFLTIAAVGLAVYKRVYLFDGYPSTRVFCFLCMAFMSVGSVLAVIGWLAGLRRNSRALNIRNAAMSVTVFVVSAVLVSILVYALLGSPFYRRYFRPIR